MNATDLLPTIEFAYETMAKPKFQFVDINGNPIERVYLSGPGVRPRLYADEIARDMGLVEDEE